MRKIDAVRGWRRWDGGRICAVSKLYSTEDYQFVCRIIRESDWRKLTALRKAAHELCRDHLATSVLTVDLRKALDALEGKEGRDE